MSVLWFVENSGPLPAMVFYIYTSNHFMAYHCCHLGLRGTCRLNIIICYLFLMSPIVFYFLHGTSVPAFYIDEVLSLSIGGSVRLTNFIPYGCSLRSLSDTLSPLTYLNGQRRCHIARAYEPYYTLCN